jgi:hypothetical protein
MAFNLKQFEFSVYNHEHESASLQLIELLHLIDLDYGRLNNAVVELNVQSGIVANHYDDHILGRIAAAITALFTDANFTLTDQGFLRIASYHRWLAGIFAAGPFGNADHILRSLNQHGAKVDEIQVSNKDLSKYILFAS